MCRPDRSTRGLWTSNTEPQDIRWGTGYTSPTAVLRDALEGGQKTRGLWERVASGTLQKKKTTGGAAGVGQVGGVIKRS